MRNLPVIDSDNYEIFTSPFSVNCEFNFMCVSELDVIEHFIIISLARTPEIGQGVGRILSCGARKPEQT